MNLKITLHENSAKDRKSKYMPGERGRSWLEIQTEKRQVFVIGGWVESDNGTAFRTLLFGTYEKGKLKFVGHAGHGFTEKDKPTIKEKLKKFEVTKCPFVNPRDIEVETALHWVKPGLIANIKFATYTSSGKIRKPAIFLGFRDDKKTTEVILEKPQNISKKINNDYDSNWKELDKQKITSRDAVNIERKDVELTNVEKELWKGVTKADLIQYYNAVADNF